VHPASSAGYAYKSDAREVLKMVGEVLKRHGKAKMGWLTGVNWIQKNASFKSKHEKQVLLVSGPAKCTALEPLGTKSLLLD
jgi:hypothetical protein